MWREGVPSSRSWQRLMSPAPVVEDANQLFMTLVVVAALLSVATAWSA